MQKEGAGEVILEEPFFIRDTSEDLSDAEKPIKGTMEKSWNEQ